MSSSPSSSTKKGSAAAAASSSSAQTGLRQFSLLVCQKCEAKGRTTYAEVADELVKDFTKQGVTTFDHKNIRRRVYDALNVLMAMEIIEKDKNKKEIKWLGLPTDSEKAQKSYEEQIQVREDRLEQKRKLLKELKQRQMAIRNLVQRNAMLEATDPGFKEKSQDRLDLPFVLINAPRNARINCEMLEDRSQYFFDFDVPFLINEDIEILTLMGLNEDSNIAPSIINASLPSSKRIRTE